MWIDVETLDDLLNFQMVADTAAKVIESAGDQPISIGVSGDWGAGKSSLSKMIVESLRKNSSGTKYIFIEFDAWLYQGFDDAKMALLQKVSDCLFEEAKNDKKLLEKVKDFAKRINLLRMGKMLAPVLGSAIVGGVIGGPVGAVITAVGNIAKSGFSPNSDDLIALETAYQSLSPQLSGLLMERSGKSIPNEISEIRAQFGDILKDLKSKLVVVVDDLDRCLPSTSISTLEAIRLLLFMPNTAFIIAADEQMIRNAVRTHFGDNDLPTDLVTSYFDKLIQVPIRMPRLGTNEVKAYLMLLFAQNKVQEGILCQSVYQNAKESLATALKQAWSKEITFKVLEEAFGENAHAIQPEIELADQLAWILVNSDKIRGNPRLIKRFLNDLMIRKSIAEAHGITVSFDDQVKIQLFERCASPRAYQFLLSSISHIDGKIGYLSALETSVQAREDKINYPDESWNDSFVRGWLELKPNLGDTDFRPLVYLCRDHDVLRYGQDELSPEGLKLFEFLKANSRYDVSLVERIKGLGESEAKRVFTRMKKVVRTKQWESKSVIALLHLPKAFPSFQEQFIILLQEIPGEKRAAGMIPHLASCDWCATLVKEWNNDPKTPEQTKLAIKANVNGG